MVTISKRLVKTAGAVALLLVGAVLAGPAAAHGFGQVYRLPVPVSLYLWGASAALILSFVVVAWFVTAGKAERNERSIDLRGTGFGRALEHPATRIIGRVLALAALLLTIATGLFGTHDPYSNLSMTLFWIVFVLGFAYLTALIGNSFSAINPWLVLCLCIEKLFPNAFAGRFAYPERAGYWPACAIYYGFIWFELFGRSKPLLLGELLAAYTLFNLVGAALVGRALWFSRVEFFSVFFDVLGRMAPIGTRGAGHERHLVLRQPFVGLTEQPVARFSLLIFILFMLSSTAFDGIKNTIPYVRIYWVHLAEWTHPLIGEGNIRNFPLLRAIWPWWQSMVLLLSPFLYLGVYWLFIWLTRLVTRSDHSLMDLALRFAYSLVPIVFVYHLTHYYTLLLTQGTRLVTLISDPFGFGWNLFGTADIDWRYLPQAGTIWHTQVWLIVAGHIVSVYLAHIEALRLFGDSRRAAISQIPMLLLMVALTTIGLWILSLPLSRGG